MRGISVCRNFRIPVHIVAGFGSLNPNLDPDADAKGSVTN